MKIEIDITNEQAEQAKKLYDLLNIPLGQSRLETAIHEFLIDNGVKESDVMVTVCNEQRPVCNLKNEKLYEGGH